MNDQILDLSHVDVTESFPDNLLHLIQQKGVLRGGLVRELHVNFRNHLVGLWVYQTTQSLTINLFCLKTLNQDGFPCHLMTIDFVDSNLGIIGLRCEDQDEVSGSEVLEISQQLGRVFHWNLRLRDDSFKIIHEFRLSLKLLCLVRFGFSWYERHGFRPKLGHPTQLIEEFRNFRFKDVIIRLIEALHESSVVDLTRIDTINAQTTPIKSSQVVSDLSQCLEWCRSEDTLVSWTLDVLQKSVVIYYKMTNLVILHEISVDGKMIQNSLCYLWKRLVQFYDVMEWDFQS